MRTDSLRPRTAFSLLASVLSACGSPSSTGQPSNGGDASSSSGAGAASSGQSTSGSIQGSGNGSSSGSGAGPNSGSSSGSSAGSSSGSSSGSKGGSSGGSGGTVGGDASSGLPGDAGDGGSADATSGSGVDAASLSNITVWIAGDSTVQNYAAGNTQGNGGTTLEGWGQELGQFFISKVTVNNQAIGGRSVAFFMFAVAKDSAGNYLCVDAQGNPQYQLDSLGNRVDGPQWATIKAGIKAGDFLLIQFGTNDETHTCPRFVSLADFETDLGMMADTVRAKGATPILVTPMGHRAFNSDGTVNDTLLPYANAMKAEATGKSVEVEDLNLRSVEYYQMVGNAFLATNIFDTGTTHFIKAGATKMAELIAGEVRRNNGPLAAYLK